jgi:hypothetical protein
VDIVHKSKSPNGAALTGQTFFKQNRGRELAPLPHPPCRVKTKTKPFL